MTQIISPFKKEDKKNGTKIIKEKSLSFCEINCLDLIKYKNKEYIVMGLGRGTSSIEIYDSKDLELIGRNDTDLENEDIIYISKMFNQNLLFCGYQLRIFTFYFDNDILIIKLVQLIEFPEINNKYNILREERFKKAFVLDRNLYRDSKNKISSLEGEIIVNGSIGIFIYKWKEKDNRENNEEGNN